jgi:hypothetical protein
VVGIGHEAPQAADRPLPAASDALEWSAERYAQYCAELYSWPDQSEQVYARHGLARPDVRARVHEHWRQRLAADPALHDRWAAGVARARAELGKPRS